MARAQAGAILRHIYPLVDVHREQSDGQLLQRFAAHREEEAFAALMRRHGRLVWGVCRHVLGNEHDAEDAFQATFLVLARRAAAIRKGESVGSWLHGVAYRIAVRARRAVTRRQEQERSAARAAAAPPPADLALRELQATLDEEVARLPGKYRAPFVLCCLQGRGRADAAADLGWKEGTVSSRLAQARRLLQQRLARRGVTLSAVLTAGALTGETAPAALLRSTRKAALLVAAGRGGAGARAVIAVVLLLTAGIAGVSHFVAPRPSSVGPGDPALAREPKPDLPAGVLTRIASGRLRHSGRLRAMAGSPDGKLLATGGAGRLRVWDAGTGLLLHQLEVSSDWYQRITFSPDAPILTSIDGYHDLTCRRLDLRTGKELSRFHLDLDGDAGLSEDGALLAVVCEDQTARLFDTATGRKTGEFRTAPVGKDVRLAVRPDGKALAVANTKDGNVRIYAVPTGRLLAQHQGSAAPFTAIRYSPDGRSLAVNSGEARGAIRLWDAATGKERCRLHGSRASHREVSFSKDGKLLAAAGSAALDFALWDLTTGRQVRRFLTPSPQGRVLLSPDGKALFTESRDGAVLAWDTDSGNRLPISAHPVAAVRELRFDSSGKRLIGRADCFRTWDPLSGREVRQFPLVMGLTALSPDATLLANSTDDGAISLVDVATGRAVRTWKAHDRTLWTLVFSADGKRLFSTGGWDPRIRVWEVANGRRVAEMIGGREGVTEVAASPDGRFLVSSGNPSTDDCDLRLWDLTTGRELRQLSVHRQMPHHPVFSPDGRWLAAATRGLRVANSSGEVHVWEAATGRLLGVFAGHKQMVTAIAFSSDGRTLATGSVDRSVCLWDLAGGKERKRLLGHQGTILSLAFAPDDRRLAASSPDAPVYLWDVAALTRRDRPAGALTAARREALWQELGDDDPGKAYPAVIALAAAPGQAVPMLREKLRPVAIADAGRTRGLLADLDSDRLAVREKASAELARLGESAVPALRDALAHDPSPEVARRVNALLKRAANTELSRGLLRGLRAVAVLEQIGSPEAKQLLRKLAGGVAEARLTRDARAALERLLRRS